MKRSTLFTMLVALLLCAAPLLISAAKVGEAAPDFTAIASNGTTFHLADFHGKYVVLEWHNNGCPYVRKHYNSGNMQRLQKQWTGAGIVWFTILSSAPGKQGYMTAAVRAVVPFAFATLRLHRLEAACIPTNAGSIRLLENTGFTREGYAREYLCINGTWQDHLLYARLKDAPRP